LQQIFSLTVDSLRALLLQNTESLLRPGNDGLMAFRRLGLDGICFGLGFWRLRRPPRPHADALRLLIQHHRFMLQAAQEHRFY